MLDEGFKLTFCPENHGDSLQSNSCTKKFPLVTLFNQRLSCKILQDFAPSCKTLDMQVFCKISGIIMSLRVLYLRFCFKKWNCLPVNFCLVCFILQITVFRFSNKDIFDALIFIPIFVSLDLYTLYDRVNDYIFDRRGSRGTI